MARPARPEQSKSARSSRQFNRFYHSINPDRVFGTHSGFAREVATKRGYLETISSETDMQLQSTLTCPKCSYQAVETMPTDACQFFYDCRGCGERLKPLAGDCCVFGSYGSVPCPPIQENKSCC